jgi:hypothetical protein
MSHQEFAKVLVQELVDKAPSRTDLRKFHLRNGIDSGNLNDADEIWKVFVRYNLESLGTQSLTVEKHWNATPANSILKQRTTLCGMIRKHKQNGPLQCYNNYTRNCKMLYSKDKGFSFPAGCSAMNDVCPVEQVTRAIGWHRAHYKVAKIIVECAKRLLLEDNDGSKCGNINDVVKAIIGKYKSIRADYKVPATKELIHRFNNIQGYGNPPKVIVWMLSDLSSPVHQINHWPDIDISQLTPVDTHVQRLAVRFGFVSGNQSSSPVISKRITDLYPEEPRKLDFALFRLASEPEENICGKTPNCQLCKAKFLKVYHLCPARQQDVSQKPFWKFWG